MEHRVEIRAATASGVLLREPGGGVRVVLTRPTLADLVEVSITQPRRYGASDPQVMARLFELLAELAWHVPPGEQRLVTTHLDRLRSTVAASDFDATETMQLEQARQNVLTALTRVQRTDHGDA